MSFTRIGPNDATSSEGFSVRVRNFPFRIEYCDEFHRQLIVGQDIGSNNGRSFMIVYADSVKEWLPPHTEHLAEDQKNEVVERISTALEFLEIPFEIYRKAKVQITGDRLRSDDGYEVEVMSDGKIRYSIAGRFITISPMATSRDRIRIHISQVRSWDLPSAFPVAREEQALILQRLSESLQQLGIKHFEILKD